MRGSWDHGHEPLLISFFRSNRVWVLVTDRKRFLVNGWFLIVGGLRRYALGHSFVCIVLVGIVDVYIFLCTHDRS